MASTWFFRHPNGDERRVALTETGRDKALVAVASVASDISNAVKVLTRVFEGQVADGSEFTNPFLAGKLKLAVVCNEPFHYTPTRAYKARRAAIPRAAFPRTAA